ncbi:MAG: TonB-dependent receptor [Acidobacteria bacterium]|nr:TonB-dependent receptor [Acidobacteriota bacterium]
MNFFKKLARPAAVLLCGLMMAFAVGAQQITATVSGTVTDPNGAVVPGATVTAASVDTGLTKTATSGDDGNYTITFLPPGTYNITIVKTGFTPVTRDNIRLEVAQTASLDVALGISTQATVEVGGDETPLLQNDTSNLETTIEQRLVEDLPSAERNIFSFVNLVPGAIDTGAALGNPGSQIGSSANRNFFDSNFAINGGRASSNDVLLDGVTNTIGDFNGVTISPPQDAVREFKVVSGVAPAEYGRTGGGIVTIASKAGTRRFHGALYEYFQDGNLNANGFRNNRNSIDRINSSAKHQFGGAIGGPLFFPGFGEGVPFIRKFEKTFFFANYEGRREKNPTTRILTLPTARMRTGDLGELLTGAVRSGVTNADGTPALFGQIYSPFAPVTGGGVTRRNYFPGNNLSTLPVCTTATNRQTTPCLDPVALAVLRYLPLPNRPGLVNNYAFADNTIFNRDIFSGRIDHTVSDKQSFFVRFSYEKRYNAPPNFLGSIAAPVTVQRDTFLNTTFNHVYSLSATLINNFRYGYTRAHAQQASDSLGFDPTTLGFAPNLAQAASQLIFPTFNIGSTVGAGEIGTGIIGGAGNDQPRDTQMAGDSLTYVTGAHVFRFGAEYRLYRFYPFQFSIPSGSFSFTRAATAGPVPSAVVSPVEAAGSSFASFLLGIPSGITREVQQPITIYHHYGAGFVQDDWKIRRNLTLNLGLRWDFETGTASPQNLITNFDFDAPSPIAANVQNRLNSINLDPAVAALNPGIRNLTGRLSFPEGSQQDTNKNRFAPRVGFAYSINPKTTLRGGVGLFFLPISLEGSSALGTSFTDSVTQTSFASGTGQVTAATIFLSDPFRNGVRTAIGNSLGALTSLGQNLDAVVEPHRPNPYNWQFNLVLQRELAKNLVLDIAFVGSRGRNLPSRNINLNQLSTTALDYARANYANPGACATTANPNASCATVAAFLTQPVANPFQGSIPSVAAFNGATIARAQLLRRFPQYQTVTQFSPNIGRSNYNALQINLQKRFSDGFSLLANYTWSKLLDTGGVGNGARFTDPTNAEDVFNLDQEYSYSTLDVPHRLTVSGTYELPIGRGKLIGKNWDRLTDALLGGFQVSGSGVYQIGTPLTITYAIGFPTSGLSAVGNLQIRPNRIPGVDPMAGNFGDLIRQGLPVFNPDAFSAPSVSNFEFGTAARTYNDIRRDSYKNVDLSIIKNIKFDEVRKIQLRMEFLNAFNNVVFGTPVTTFGNANFGTYANQDVALGNRPRVIQLVGRFTF